MKRDASLPNNAGGFTLLEVLVALTLLALFSTASYRALDVVLDAQSRAKAELARWQKVDGAFVRLQADLQDAVVAAPLAAFVAERTATGEIAFGFERQRGEAVEGGLQRVAYRFASRQLLRSAGSPIRQDVPPAQVPLLDGLERVGIRYMNAAGNWQAEWGAVGELPRAVEVALAWPDGWSVRRVFVTQ